MPVQILKFKRQLTDEEGELLKGAYIDENYIKYPIIDSDTDGFDEYGSLLFRFRKGVLPLETLELGVASFEDSISFTDSRGMAAGGSYKRIRKDGTTSKITVSDKVYSGAAGFLDRVAMIPYCRKTAFTAKYFEKYKQGIPFVKAIDKLYRELAPDHYAVQKQYAEGTNPNFVIADTAFTTITINRNFRTALHKDSGDLPQGFGNLIVHRKGTWEGGYFMLPEFGIGIDLQNTDILFVDVHKWHCNSDFRNCSEDWQRTSFVIYYREYMLQCASPSKELEKIKIETNGFFRL
jgi:hypothetical protein